jgi:hypothetical protein
MRRLLTAAVLLLTLVLAALFLPRQPAPAVTPVRDPTARRVGKSEHLFNGRDTGGWRPEYGNWVWNRDNAALRGDNGLIAHQIPLETTLGGARAQPAEFYELEVVFCPLPSGDADIAQELRFGVCGDEATAYALRRTGDTLQIGECNHRPPPQFQPRDETVTQVPSDRAVAVTLERQPTGWFVLVNGDLVASLPFRGTRERPEFQLAAIGDDLEFSDVLLNRLEFATEN